MTKCTQLWITTNSPGELASWVTPIVQVVKAEFPDVEVVVALVPCQYSSGHELEIATRISGVTRAYSPSQTLNYLLKLKWGGRRGNGAVLYLGGDPMYAKWLGLTHRWPVIAYTEHGYSLGFGIRTTLRKSVIGDLMASRIALRQPITSTKDIDIVFFTGSRPAHFDVFAPFCVEVARHLLAERPGIKIAIQRSLFIDDERWTHFCSTQPLSGIDIFTGSSLESLERSRLMVSLPGTSTAEAMYMQTPMVVLVPLNRPELIQLDGLVGIIGMIPWVGTQLKKAVIRVMIARRRLVALPNIMAQREVIPEIVGVLEPIPVARQLLDVLDSPVQLAEQRVMFDQFPATTVAATAIVEELRRWI